MNAAFYTAGAGASAHQSKMNVISNNMANISTTGFKRKVPVFADLVYSNYPSGGGPLQTGNGLKIDKTSDNFAETGAPIPTEGKLDFALNGEGFFAVSQMDGEEVLYTRDGRFAISYFDETPYLTNTSGMLVLNADGEPIEMDGLTTDAKMEELNIGVFSIPVKDGMISEGYGNYSITEKNGEPELIEFPKLLRGALEASNVDMATEMTQVMEAQRAFSFALKMVQTSDELEQEINALRR